MKYIEHIDIISKLKFLIQEKKKHDEFHKLSDYEFLDIYIKEETLRKIEAVPEIIDEFNEQEYKNLLDKIPNIYPK